jgi:hypothetical protein
METSSKRICKPCGHQWEPPQHSDEEQQFCPNCNAALPTWRHCQRCLYGWEQRRPGAKPRQCPFCKSPKWDLPFAVAKPPRPDHEPDMDNAAA